MYKESDKDVLLMRSKYLKQKAYWMNKLSGDFDATDFFDIFEDSKNERKQPAKIENQRIEISFHDELIKRIIGLSKGSDLSIYILLLSALQSLIFRYTFDEDIIILSPVNKLKIKEETINSQLFIRNHVDGDLTFKELILEVRQSVLDAYENQDYPYDKLMEHLFPASGEQDKKLISNIRCSFGNLHSDKEIKEIKARLSFHFLREGGQLSGYLLFEVGTCKEGEVTRFSNHLVHFLSSALKNVNAKISNILFLTEEEKKQLLVDFNDNRADFSRNRTICHFIEDNVEKRPDSPAIVFLNDEITYRDLNRGANQLAERLRESGVGEDRTVGILLERSPWMVKSILAVWKAGGAYIPLHSNFPSQRILDVLSDSQTGVLITESKHVDSDLQASYNGKIIKLDVDKQVEALEDRDMGLNLEINMSSLSYVIYTSGSTGKPKGVMVEHIGMMNHIGAKINDLHLSGKSIVAQNASHTFDISVWQFFVALILGGRTVIYPDEVVFDPNRFISQLIEHRVTILEVVPSYLSVILEFLDSDFRPLNFLDYLLVTGEIVKPALVKRWFDKYPGIKMVNAYGPTEASDDITHFVMDTAVDEDRIPIGKTIQNLTIYIVDKYMNVCPIGVKGEIWVSGIGVGRGYLNDETKTQEVFTTDPFTDTKGVRLYKTGDLGRWLPAGTIEFFGRKDYQIKIRGFRIELGEIESQLSAHPNIKEAVVIIKESDDKYLFAYLVTVTEEEMDISGFKEYLGERLPYYMVPDHFVQLKHMPLTPNGKIDRTALSRLDDGISTRVEYVAPRNQVEGKLAEIWAEVLEIEKDIIGIDSNFFQLGGHSLRATLVISKIQKVFDVKLSLQDLFRNPTIRGIYGITIDSEENKFVSIEPVEEKDYHVLSSAQKKLYVLHQLELEGVTYNMSWIIPLRGVIEKEKLEDTFKKLIERHESLRTSFVMKGREPVQKIHKMGEVEFRVHYYDLEGASGNPPLSVSLPNEPGGAHKEEQPANSNQQRVSTIIKKFIRPFDLTQPPLLRVGLIRIEKEKHIFIADIHHIIDDGTSEDVLTREFISLYEGGELPLLRLQYKDYAEWMNSPQQKENVKKQENYWLKDFEGDIPVLNLPTDYPRPAIQSFEGSKISFRLEKEEVEALRKIELEQGVTMYMILLTLYIIFLSRITGQEDIIVGTDIDGRRHADLEHIIGVFINILPLRNFPAAEKTFNDFLREVKERTIKAFENQDYQLENLAERLLVNRDASRNPIFDVMFSYLDKDNEAAAEKTQEERAPGFMPESESYQYESGTAKFDLLVNGVKTRENLSLSFEYCTKLFRAETIKKFIRYFKDIVSAVIENREIKLKDIPISHHFLAASTNAPPIDFGF